MSITLAHISSSASSWKSVFVCQSTSGLASTLYRRSRDWRSKINTDPRPSSSSRSSNAKYAATSGERVNDTLGWPGSEQNKTPVLRIRACTHKCRDVGFWGLSGNLRLDQSITDFDPVQTCATRNLAAQMSI